MPRWKTYRATIILNYIIDCLHNCFSIFSYNFELIDDFCSIVMQTNENIFASLCINIAFAQKIIQL